MALHLEIVTPEKKIFSDTVGNVYLPGADGELGILDGHAALVTALQPGELRYDKDGKTDVAVFRESEGNWYVSLSSTGGYTVRRFGMLGDVPIPAAYIR